MALFAVRLPSDGEIVDGSNHPKSPFGKPISHQQLPPGVFVAVMPAAGQVVRRTPPNVMPDTEPTRISPDTPREPMTSNLFTGVVVPMPTLPPVNHEFPAACNCTVEKSFEFQRFNRREPVASGVTANRKCES